MKENVFVAQHNLITWFFIMNSIASSMVSINRMLANKMHNYIQLRSYILKIQLFKY